MLTYPAIVLSMLIFNLLLW